MSRGVARFNDGYPREQVLDKADIEKAHMVGQIKREISIMKRLRHPNVVELKDVMATKTKARRLPPQLPCCTCPPCNEQMHARLS